MCVCYLVIVTRFRDVQLGSYVKPILVPRNRWSFYIFVYTNDINKQY